MNVRKLADALRLAAEALEEDAEDAPVERVAVAAARTRPRTFPAPLGEVSEVDAARARKMLRRRGIST